MIKCPKCGATMTSDTPLRTRYGCGTTFESRPENTDLNFTGDLQQSDLCRSRCELAALKERHAGLVEAARNVVADLTPPGTCTWDGENYYYEIPEERIDKLKWALKSEGMELSEKKEVDIND